MAKSIIEIDVQDERFQAFIGAYENYQKSLNDMPAAWREVGEAAAKASKPVDSTAGSADDLASSFKAIVESNLQLVAAINASSAGAAKLNKNGSGFSKSMGSAKRFLQDGAKAAKGMASDIKDATFSFLKWGSVLGIFSGLVGAGGLFGINRMAASASAQRFTAQGLNTTSGGLDSVAVNYSRALDNPVSTLGNIRDAQSDLSRRWAFNATGVNPNGDPSDILPQLIKNSRDIFKNSGSTLQGAEAHGLTQFFSIDDLNRFKNMSDAEIDSMAKRAQADARMMQINDQTLKQWQDFNVQLDRSGVNIRSAFITGLAPLTPKLERLSQAVSDFINHMLKSPQVGQWIDMASRGLEKFGKYLTSPEFENDAKHFLEVLGKLGSAIGTVATWIGNKFGGTESKPGESKGEFRLAPSLLGNDRKLTMSTNGFKAEYTTPVAERNHNPLNIRKYGSKEFMNFDDDAEGFRRAAWQMRRYGSGATTGKPIDTVKDIVSTWAPASDNNNTKAYIDAVVKRTGYQQDQHLDLNNPSVLSKLLAAMSKQENSRSNFSAEQVKIYITNSTGGSAIVSGGLLAGGQ